MMRKTCVFIMVLALAAAAVGVANASTSADKQAAIDKGLAYLDSTKVVSGSQIYWNYGGYEVASTAAALLAFTEQKYKPLGWNGKDYSAVVMGATNFLLNQAQQLNFSAPGYTGPNWWGFNGTGNTGYGIQWNIGGEETYQSGIAVTALSRLVSNPYGGSPIVSPSTVISTGNAVTNGRTYADLIQKVVDGFTYYQTGPGGSPYPFTPVAANRYGGWRYYSYATYGQNADSDMSTTQWGPISYLFASQVPGVTIPNGNVKTALQAWLTADQYASGVNKGGVDYQPGYGIINATHAGGFLLSHLFAGGGGSMADAQAWLNGDWLTPPSGTWWGNEGQPYAMWAVYKGLEANFGTTAAGPITNLHAQTTPLDPGAIWNWWEDYCQFLVLDQSGDGSWPGYSYWYGPLEAAWYINILNATKTGPVVPLPGTLGLLGTGLVSLLGAGWWRRKA